MVEKSSIATTLNPCPAGIGFAFGFSTDFRYWTKVQCTASQLFAKDYAIWLPMLSEYCHPERSEGSRSQILRFAQNDT
jgi:hypothetical protein